MTTPLPWIFEPCENEGPVCDPAGQPWEHAVRGRKPAGRVVTGYGHTESAADHDARTKAQQYDAREILGERGEVKIVAGMQYYSTTRTVGVTIETTVTPDDVRRELEVWSKEPHVFTLPPPITDEMLRQIGSIV